MPGPNKVTAPIARSTAYDFNCHLSQSHTGDVRSRQRDSLDSFGVHQSGEVLDVMPHEFLYEVVGGRHAHAARMKAKSSLNGVVLDAHAAKYIDQVAQLYLGGKCDFSTKDGRKKMKKLLDDSPHYVDTMNRALNRFIRYVGVAVTGIQGGPATAAQRQGFSATRGGLMTIVHRGAPIPAGSRVAMEFDIRDILEADTGNGDIQSLRDADAGGVPRSKILPRLVVVDDATEAVYDMKESLAGIRKSHTVRPFELLMPAVHTVARGGLPFADLSA